MTVKTNCENAGRLIRARILAIDTETSNVEDVSGIGVVDVELRGKVVQIGTASARIYGIEDAPCCRADLIDAVTVAVRPDVLVVHDLSRARELMPPSLIGNLPWIGLGRLLVQAYPEAPASDLKAVVGWMGRSSLLASSAVDQPHVERQAALAALVFCHLREPMGGWLDRMVLLSSGLTRPINPTPDLSDGRGWANMPAADVRWLSTYEEARRYSGLAPDAAFDTNVGARAMREWQKRRLWQRQ